MIHNGDDAIALYNGTSNIDVIGVIGVDPGTNWTVGSGSTKDHLLKRKSSVITGVTTWNTSQWDIYDDETWSALGSQTCDCYTNTRDFSANAYTYTNGGGSYASSGGIGLYANTGNTNKEVFISYQLCTDETNTTTCGNTSRFIQVGDVLSFQMKGSQALGEVGVILNSSPSFSQSYSSKNSNAALELYLGGHGNPWTIIHLSLIHI